MMRSLATGFLALMLSMVFAGFGLAKDKYHAGPVEARDHGYEHGYRDGFHHGAIDRDRHDKFKPEVKDADAGYEKYMGDKDQYKEGYRSGFVKGYDDGFNNRPGQFSAIYGPYDQPRVRGDADRADDIYAERGWSASHVASDMGYRDGLAAGEADYAQRLQGRPEDHGDFRDGDHGYRSVYGDRLLYQREYRDSFVQGYRDAYSGRR